jgi:hypothetical protein
MADDALMVDQGDMPSLAKFQDYLMAFTASSP